METSEQEAENFGNVGMIKVSEMRNQIRKNIGKAEISEKRRWGVEGVIGVGKNPVHNKVMHLTVPFCEHLF